MTTTAAALPSTTFLRCEKCNGLALREHVVASLSASCPSCGFQRWTAFEPPRRTPSPTP